MGAEEKRFGSPGEYDRPQTEVQQQELGEQAPHLVGNVIDVRFGINPSASPDYEDPIYGADDFDMGAHGEHHPNLGKYLKRGAVAVAIGAMAYGAARHIKKKG